MISPQMTDPISTATATLDRSDRPCCSNCTRPVIGARNATVKVAHTAAMATSQILPVTSNCQYASETRNRQYSPVKLKIASALVGHDSNGARASKQNIGNSSIAMMNDATNTRPSATGREMSFRNIQRLPSGRRPCCRQLRRHRCQCAVGSAHHA